MASAVRFGEVSQDAVRVFALGGIGEIGRNMTVVETSRGSLIIDCGLLFPSNDLPGVDYVLPDFSPLATNLDSLRGLVLTHGHEDHIGGVPHLLKLAPDLPVYGTQFTLALLAGKLAEQKVTADLHEIREGDVLSIDGFECEFYAVNHSVPDGVALSVTVNDRQIFHTGDFKLDQQPLDRRLTDIGGFAAAGARGVDLLLSDSTNADVPGHLPDEVDVAPNFVQIFDEAPGLVLVACFASHVHRVQQVITCAAAVGRRVALVGRSMERNMRIATEVGLLHIPDGVLVAPNEINTVDRRDLVIACTGSQGEPMAVLSRLARGEHKIVVGDDDTVILSARLIPGNEVDVFRVINGLSERGVSVLHGGNANIHASGHAPAGELREILNVVRPRFLMPIHGEWRHLRAHASIARSVGIDGTRVVFAPNGTVIELDDGGVHVVGKLELDSIMVDTTSYGHVDDVLLHDRRVMGAAGMLLVSIALDADGVLAEPPRIVMRGMNRDDQFLHKIGDLSRQAVEDVKGDDGVSKPLDDIERLVGKRITRWLRSERRRLPALQITVTMTR